MRFVVGMLLVLVLSVSAYGQYAEDFWAPWCGPCLDMKPVIYNLQTAGFDIRSINVDEHSDVRDSMQVSKIPTIIFFVPDKNGGFKEATRLVGPTSEGTIRSKLKTYGIKNKADRIRDNKVQFAAASRTSLGITRLAPTILMQAK